MSAKESIVQYAEKRTKKLVNIKCESYIKQMRLSTDRLCTINKKCGNCEQNEGREKHPKNCGRPKVEVYVRKKKSVPSRGKKRVFY